MIVSIHVTHVSAGGTVGLNNVVPLLEKTVPDFIKGINGVQEYVIVRTCNRFELYTACTDNSQIRPALREFMQRAVPSSDISYLLEDKESIKHLFRVVCGLESLIVGEDQIQHQVRECYNKAREEGHVNGILSRLFDKAIIVGKRVRSETALNKGAVSVGSAAVELAESKLGDLEGKGVTILGAGDMASVIAKNLAGKNLGTIIVSNRTFSRATELAQELGGVAISMDMVGDALVASDVVLVATSAPHTVLHRPAVEAAMASRPDRKMLIIDVSIPHNVDEDVAEIPNVDLDNMDSLEYIAKHNAEMRTKEINSAEKIVLQELEKLDVERKEAAANDIIRRLGIKFSDIRHKELEFALARDGASDHEELLDDLSRAIVNKITADLYINLRKASREGDISSCEAVENMFGLEDVE